MTITFFAVIYALLLVGISIFSWGFVDANMTLPRPDFLYDFVLHNRASATVLFTGLQVSLFLWYVCLLRLVHQKGVSTRNVVILIVISMAALLFSFPGFSYDIFNYIATAKVTYFWRENPYLVMPIEIPNEPSLAFLHASNKVALYGPSWILLTAVPHVAGMGNLFVTFFTFKVFVYFFYIGTLRLIWKISKSPFSLAFFALNPLVTIETLGNGHNDVVMMFFALFAFYLLEKKRYVGSCVALIFSILIKYATIALMPIYIYSLFSSTYLKIVNKKRLWIFCAVAMYGIFFLSPLREEIYAWYLIWPLTYVALLKPWSFIQVLTLGFSFGLPLRFTPFIYFRNWGGVTPLIKKLVTFIPPSLISLAYAIYKKR